MSGRRRAAFIESSYTGAGYECIQWCLRSDVSPVLLTRDATPYGFIEELGARLQVVRCDTTSVEAIESAVADLEGEVCFATTDDYSVALAARLRNRHGQATSDPDAIAICRNKARLREALAARFSRLSARFWPLKGRSIPEAVSWPAVVKPTNFTGSIGVRLCSGPEDLVEHMLRFEGYIPPGSFEAPQWQLEEFLKGDEFSVELFDEEVIGFTKKFKFEPVGSTGHCNTAWSLSAGAWNPKVLRGR